MERGFFSKLKFGLVAPCSLVPGMNKSAIALIVIVAAVVASGLPLFTVTSATTYAGSVANGNATWTASNSPYSLTGNLVINNGETLNIQPGVVVHLNGYQIQVYGLLNAQGSSSNKIYFLSDGLSGSQIFFEASSSVSCVIDYGVFYSVPVTVMGSSPKIADSYLTSTTSDSVIRVNAGFPTISGNTISAQNNQNGIYINSGNVAITSNTISGGSYGIYNSGGVVNIVSNTIIYCYSGIYTGGSATIQQNVIMHNSNDGIVTQTSAVSITYNAIAFNTCGISRDGNIQNNTISQNTYGLWGQTSLSTIKYNNIVDNTAESVHLTETGVNVDASNNWWGTTDETIISGTISDYSDHSNLGTLTFEPFLTQPAYAPTVPTSVVLPTVPPTPTATPTPTAYYATPASTPNDTYTPTPSPTATAYSPSPTAIIVLPTPDHPVEATDGPVIGSFSSSDIATAVVILVAVSAAAVIIVVINRRFGQRDMKP